MNKRFSKWEHPTFDDKGMTKWNWICQHPENLKLGKYVDIGAFTYINAKYGVVIEDYVQIGSHVSIYSISTIDNKEGQVIIKKNAMIGAHSMIMPGITVDKNSIIGAFSFVNKDIPQNVLACGIPVRVVRELSEKEI